jgi:hypothetical protein
MVRNQGRGGEGFGPSRRAECFSSTSSPKVVVVDMGRTDSSLGERGDEGVE